jgi:hypothetical protein
MGFDILPTYFSTRQMVGMAAAIVLLLAGLVLLFIFGPKREKRMNLKKSLPGILLSIVIVVTSWSSGPKIGFVSNYFGNLWDAYKDYGVPYGFITTWMNTGIRKPAGYSKAMVDKIFTEDEFDDTSSALGKTQEDFPNIVFLQLESFIDPSEVKQLSFSTEPVPFFKSLKENYSSGYLTVPVVGGGTSNTEFEVMSGMSMRYFGPGEYPYKSILTKQTCETLAYDLGRLGFGTHAIHNHRGAFYNRNVVFANLGYDDFTSLEYMNYVSKTPKNFATDDVLTGEILGALASTEEKDYIYTISVQGHGKYPAKRTISEPRVRVEGLETDAETYTWEYYIEQLMEMDDFIKTLTEEFENFDEDVVLIMYGDHLPALDIEGKDTRSGSIYQTEYIIWSNFDLEKKDKSLNAYQLAADVQKRIGMREGTMFVYHQDHIGKPKYLENLHTLQYDMLYGRRYVYGEKNPFEATDMNMGYAPIHIDEIIQVGSQYYIKGTGFTPFSKVSLHGEILDTIYMTPTVLNLLEEVSPDDVSKMKVSQVEKYNSILSTTE